MKKLHLICNSHIDPVWMWDWEEGLGEAISTFYQAEQFLREYDYIFNHNEALLYEFVEEKDPELFKAILEQVKAGKWHIMGGWYLQPDCNLPSGEAFVRQISLGRSYFQEKLGIRPTTAINFDSFGHSVGLVQILKKCGFDSYLFCRPMPEMLALPAREFVWVGKDGSRVKASQVEDKSIYCSGFGTALTDIQRKAAVCEDSDVGVALWGVGNHGGLPSRKDLNDVSHFIQNAGYEVVHKVYDDVTSKFDVQFAAMDAGYKTPWIAKKTLDDGKIPVLPYTRYKGSKEGYRPWDYKYDPVKDVFTCPHGQELRHTTTDRDGKRIYRSTPKYCVNCLSKSYCKANEKGQKVFTTHIWQEYLDIVESIRKTDLGKQIYAQRKETIERVFADAKEKHAMRYTHHRGLAAVTRWVRLKFAAMNLKKLAQWSWKDSMFSLLFVRCCPIYKNAPTFAY